MKYFTRREFPCGMIIEDKMQLGLFATGQISSDTKKLYEKGCPIHGKKCKGVKR